MFRPGALFGVVVGCALGLGGCLGAEQRLVLDDDLSGVATVSVAVDLDPLAYVGALAQRRDAGLSGEPTPAEIDAARREAAGLLDSGEQRTGEELAQTVERALPDGVSLVAATVERRDLKTISTIELAFDRLDRLALLDLSSGEAAGNDPLEKPFAGLALAEDGDTITVTHAPYELIARDRAGPIAAGEEATEALLGTMHATFVIEAPFAVVEHNATEASGGALLWRYDALSLVRAPTPPDPARVRFRRR